MIETSGGTATVATRSVPAGPVVRLLSDLPGLPRHFRGYEVRNEVFESDPRGVVGRALAAVRLYFKGFGRDAIVFNQPGGLLFLLCALRTLLPFGGARLVVFDIIIMKPGRSPAGRLKAALKRLLLRRVALFLLHVQGAGGLGTHYGVPASKARFVPFKVNSLDALAALDTSDRGYVLAPGRSQRDYATFCAAVAGLPCPAVVLMPGSGREAATHGTFFDGGEVPPNVRVVHDDGSVDSWNRQMAGARLVVVPILPDAISAAGNSTYLQAMAAGKCVVVTDCPGARGIIEDGRHALIVPAGDPAALGAAIRRAWEDDDLRRRVAEGGRAYALSLGGEDRLLADIAGEVVAFLEASGRLGRPRADRADGPETRPA